MSVVSRLRFAAFAAVLVALAAPIAHAAEAPPPTGRVITVAVRDVPRRFAAEGVVEAVKQATLGAQVPGVVVDFAVKAGDSVRAGQVLARIDPRTADQAVAAIRSQIAESEANLANARRKYERNRELVAQKFVSQAALEQAEAEYKAAQAQRETLTANLDQAIAARSFTSIVAPYAGVVGATHAQAGDMAQPGRPLVTVFDPGELRVVASVPQAALARIDLREPIVVEIPALALTLTARRATVVPLADASTHTSQIRLDLPATERLLPGQYARARFVTGTVRTLAVPSSAIVRRGEVTAVYVVDANGRARLRQVRVGETVDEGEVEIRSGLSPGETIAADPVQAGMAPAVAANR